MPRRSSRSGSKDSEDPMEVETNMRPSRSRRSSSNKVSEKDKDDNDADTEPMDVDDSNSESDSNPASEVESNKNSSTDDSDDNAVIKKMVQKRRTRQQPQRKNSAKDSQTTLKIHKGSKANARRSSSRSTRFTGALKEPPSDSIRDLFQGSQVKERITLAASSRRNSLSDDEDEEVDGFESSSEEEELVQKRQVRSKSSRRSTKAKSKAPPSSGSGKSPARRHSRARKRVAAARNTSDEDDESEDDYLDEENSEDEDEDDMKIQRVLASRTETRRKWDEICKAMNTSEVTDGSRWFQEPITDETKLDLPEERFLVKWNGLSYLHCSWETQHDLIDQVDGAKTYLTTFFRKSVNGVLLDADERKDGDYFDPACCQIDRILEVFYEGKAPRNQTEEDASKPSDFGIVLTKDSDPKKFKEGTGRQFLIKWMGMNYTDCTYEFERDLLLADVDYKEALNKYYEKTQKPTKTQLKSRSKHAEDAKRRSFIIFGDKSNLMEDDRQKRVEEYQKELAEHVFHNGGQLRDYQAEGVTWFLSNYVNNRSCILADEMGLGKTLQTAAFVNVVVQKMHRHGPFLIVVPLSTMAHWQREFVGWTGLNTIVYHGSAEDRKVIRENEFAFPQDRPDSVGANALYLNKCEPHRTGGPWMTTVVVTTPEMLVADDCAELSAVKWEVLVVDEAHRLKNHNSKLAQTLRNGKFSFNHRILLTGTPIQNDVQEFWTLLNFIDPKEFSDRDGFMESYGEIKSKERIDELHELIRPYILRRLKEDVEKSVPPKEETLIEVELTLLQKQYYRALYEKNVGFLHKNKKKALDGPSLNNLAMQLRKCCNHVFLLNGVEEEVRRQQPKDIDESDFLSKGSGKFVLLDKLLPRLKQDGHRVLLFSQFKIMLDVLEDYLTAREMKFERIDGSITGHKRQQAIDRFQDPSLKDPPFVMLLSTRAGGVGINLTSADTCIIFDSDWNPQNDLQAQARCHRIGQTKNVKVYRLLTRKTYEMQMFHMSSLKMGLDQAVLKGFESGSSGEGVLTKEEVERLLRHGAYDIFNEEKTGTAEAESNDFIQQDIDSILERRARTVVHDNTGSQSNAKGGTFSKATFVAPKTPDKRNQSEDIDIEDPEFWTKMVGEAPPEVESELKPRKRNKANYSERHYERELQDAIAGDSGSESGSDSEEDASSADESEEETEERARWGGTKPTQWKRSQAESVLRALERYGYGVLPWDKFKSKLHESCSKFSIKEIHRMAWSLALVAFVEVSREDAVTSKKRAERQAEKKRNSEGAESLVETTTEGSQSESELLRNAFSKLWKSNKRWATAALLDAVNYARENDPRSLKTIEQNDQVDQITTLFYGSLWPSLKGRGWKEEVTASGKGFVYNNFTFSSPSAVLNQALGIHPELANMIMPILINLEQSRMRESEKDQADRSRHLSINSANVDTDMLQDFLQRYAPLQLIADRKRSVRLSVGRRILSSCYYLYAVNGIMRTAESDAQYKLPDYLVIDGRMALPHPLWKQEHDAILIQAIAKHGWVDREKACRAITDDGTIQWGHPFQKAKKNAKVAEVSESNVECLQSTADRAAKFLTSHPELIETFKGCNRHLIIESYGLQHDVKDGEPADTMDWKVDKDLLFKASTTGNDDSSDNGLSDLPSKKDMAKRAKAVLQKSLLSLEAGVRPGAIKSSTNTKPGEASATDYGYAIIDQGNRCCILLAEMVRGIVKASSTKMSKQIRMMCSLAYDEALALKSDLTNQEKAEEMNKLSEQIALAKRSLRTAAVPGKNILRVMIGLEPASVRNQNESMFPSETSIKDSLNTTKQQGKKEVFKRDDSALGDKAIIRSMKKAYDKAEKGPCVFSPTDDPDFGIQLTMIETLILFTFCSEGIPCSQGTPATGSEPIVTWEMVGSVLEIAAKDYYQVSKEKLEKSRAALKKVEATDDEGLKAKAATRVSIDEYDEGVKEEAAKLAVDFASDPAKLAKKGIMLLEKVRRFGMANIHLQGKHSHKFENGLGPKVPSGWLSKELSKLAQEHNVVDDHDKPMTFTTTDLLSQNPECANTPVAAYVDKKSARQVVAQIALLGRLRSIFMKHTDEDLRAKVRQAMKNSKKVEDVWEKRPAWWDDTNVGHSYLLLQRLNEHGFINIDSDANGFGSEDAPKVKTLRGLGLTRLVIQQRANQLVRELHSIDESEEMLRLLEERRIRSASKKQGFDRSLAECHAKKKASGSNKGGGIQTGLRAFFTATKTGSKKQKVIELLDDDMNSLSSSSSSGKRKGSPISSDDESTSGKKAKTSNPVFRVMAGDAAVNAKGKKHHTIVNDQGIIEMVPLDSDTP